MLSESAKDDLAKRLRRAEGQVAGVGRMIENDAYCVDVLMQISAVMAALGKVGHIVLETHIDTCVTDAFQTEDDSVRKQKIEEIMKVFSKYANIRGR